MQEEFNLPFRIRISHVLSEVRDIESERTIFKASTVAAAARSCGQKALLVDTRARQAVNLKEEAFGATPTWRSPETADRSQQARKASAEAGTKVKACV